MIIGIAGKNGSGKSTAAKVLSEILKIPVCEFDLVWGEVLKTKEISDKLVSCLGDSILDITGTVNKEKLNQIIFGKGNEGLRADHNTIVMPAVLKKVEELIQKNHGNGVLDFKLLPLTPFWAQCDFRIMVKVQDDNICMQRMLKRDNMKRKILRNRNEASSHMVLSPPNVDFVIDNSGSLEELVQACNRLAGLIKQGDKNPDINLSN